MSPAKTPVTIAYGDGIGPEIMEATLQILEEAGAELEKETIVIGQRMYERGLSAGIDQAAWDTLRRTKLFLKAPITTPQGGGFKSLNVTVRTTFGLFANVRPCLSLHPYVATKHPKMDVVIVRENEEDTYSGIEHRQTDEMIQCLKLISRPGCEKIVRYAFEYALQNGRKKVSCFIKDNIMKLTDGLFHSVFKEIGEEYPTIQKDSWIIDIGAARLADTPEIFDVIVTLNLYGDIISDVAAQISGSVGLGPSANIGDNIAMFEAIHGSAPTIAGQGIANPSGLLLASVMMLSHVNQNEVANRVHNAWLKTIEEGIHTGDIFHAGTSKKRVGTAEFTKAVIERLGQVPDNFKPVDYRPSERVEIRDDVRTARPRQRKDLVGVDIFVDFVGTPTDLAERAKALGGSRAELVMISNRGVSVWPKTNPETFCTDHWRLRYVARDRTRPVWEHSEIIELLDDFRTSGLGFIKIENLYNFDGKPGYALGHGQ